MFLVPASSETAETNELLEERIRWEHALLLTRRRQASVSHGPAAPAEQVATEQRVEEEVGPENEGSLVSANSSAASRKSKLQRILAMPAVGPLALYLWRLRHERHRFKRDKVRGFENPHATTLLFVGPWSANAGQLGLVRAFTALAELSNRNVRLALAGPVLSGEAFARVRAEIARLNLTDRILLFLNPGARELRELYSQADLFVSLSEHPLALSTDRYDAGLRVALAWDIPILAFCSRLIPSWSGPIFVSSADPDLFAGACNVALDEPWVRRHIRNGQRRQLAKLSSAASPRRWGAALNPDKVYRDAYAVKTRWSIEGPFHSSYSLAVVNRELASALRERGEDVGLVSRDGPGPVSVPAEFLQHNPRIARMWERGSQSGRIDVGLRNQYPPFVEDLRGELRGLACYAWEESGFPKAYVHDFNANLDFITVTSGFVAKVLRDNGVRSPIYVVGDGIDQITRVPDEGERRVKQDDELRDLIGDRFCFLHISSCLPRKGIDLLLKAWTQAFRALDQVILIIKATPNQHHDVAADVTRLRENQPDIAPIAVITDDLSPGDISALYRMCDVVVAPSRGEGFGLPIAEALALGKPVITTAFGGHMDYCSTESDWLCEYDFAYARSHVSEPLSVWAEPRIESLIDCLASAVRSSASERAKRGAAGRHRVTTGFSWNAVARRLEAAKAAAATIDHRVLKLPTVAWVSTWNNRCGIADYSQSLTCAFPEGRLQVFANWNAEQQLGPDSPFVRRCWEQSWRDPLDDLFDKIVAERSDIVVLQFNFGFYQIAAFSRLVERLADTGRHIYLCLHSTADIERDDLVIRLKDALPALQRARRVLVHSVHDLNRLKALGLTRNVSTLPFGMPRPPEQRGSAGPGRRRIATFGYLLPHKGALELIEAVRLLREEGYDLELLMLNATYPAQESEQLKRSCEEAIASAGLSGRVEMHTEFLPADEIISRLGSADLIVYPYQATQESASAAVRMGLASLRPVVTTPLPIFADIASVSHSLEGVAPADIAAGIRQLLQDHSRLERFSGAQEEWVRSQQWLQVSRRLYDMMRAELFNPLDISSDRP